MAEKESRETWRSFLAARLEERRGRRRVSLRQLASKAGLQSPGYLQRLLDGSRSLTPESARRVGEALSLSPVDLAHFLDLVAMGRAPDPDVARIIEARMRARTFERAAHDLSSDQASLFRHWYTPLVWTLAPSGPRAEIAAQLARQLTPLLSAGDIEKTIDTLLAEGFLQKTPDGGLRHDQTLLSISTPVSPSVLNRFYLASFAALRKLLPRLAPAQRNVRVTTFSVPVARVELVREKIRTFHKELAALAAETEGNGEPEVACQTVTAALFLTPET